MGISHKRHDSRHLYPSPPDSQNDSDQNPVKQLESMLQLLVVSRAGRLAVTERAIAHVYATPAALGSFDARPVIQALSGRWYYTQDRLGAVIRDTRKTITHGQTWAMRFVISSAGSWPKCQRS